MPEPDVLLVVGADLTQLNQQIAAIRQTMGSQIFNIPTSSIDQAGRSMETTLRQARAGFESLNVTASRSASSITQSVASINTQMQAGLRLQAQMDTAYSRTAGSLDKLRATQEQLGRLRIVNPQDRNLLIETNRLIDQQLSTLRPQASALQQIEAAKRKLIAAHKEEASAAATLQQSHNRISQFYINNARNIESQVRAADAAGARIINMQRQMGAALASLDQFKFFAPADIARVDALRNSYARLLEGVRPSQAEWARLQKEWTELNRIGHASIGMLDDFGRRFINLAKYVGAAVIIFSGLDVLRGAIQHIAQTDQQLALLSATMKDVNERAVVMPVAYDLMRHAQRTMGLSAAESGQLVKELGKALGDNVELMKASYLPALLLITSGEVDHEQAVQRVVGIYNIFGKTLDSTLSVQQKQVQLWDAMKAVADASVGSVNTLAEGVQFAGARAAAAGLNFNETISILGVFQDSLSRAGRSGQQAARLFEAILQSPGRFAKAFDIEIDITKPLDMMQLLVEMSRRVQSQGRLTAEQLQALEALFPLENASRAFNLLFLNLDNYLRLLNTADGAQGQMAHGLDQASKAVNNAASALKNSLFQAIEDVVRALTGATGQQQVFAEALRGLAFGVSGLAVPFIALGLAIGETIDILYTFLKAALAIGSLDFSAAMKSIEGLFTRSGERFSVLGTAIQGQSLSVARDRINPNILPQSAREIPVQPAPTPTFTPLVQWRNPDETLTPLISWRSSDAGIFQVPEWIKRLFGSREKGDPFDISTTFGDFSGTSGGFFPREEIGTKPFGQRDRKSELNKIIENARREVQLTDKALPFPVRLSIADKEIREAEEALKTAKSDFLLGDEKAKTEVARSAKELETRKKAKEQLLREETLAEFEHATRTEQFYLDQGKKILDIQKDLSDERIQLLGTEEEKFINSVDRQVLEEITRRTQGIKDEAVQEQIGLEIYKQGEIKKAEFQRKRLEEGNQLLADWNEKQLALAGGATRAAEQQRQQEISDLEVWYATQTSLAMQNGESTLAITELYAKRKFQIEADFRARRFQAELEDAEKLGRQTFAATLSDPTAEQKAQAENIGRGKAAIEHYEELIRLRAGYNVELERYLKDETNRVREALAIQLKMREEAIDREIATLDQLANAEINIAEKAGRARALREQASAPTSEFLKSQSEIIGYTNQRIAGFEREIQLIAGANTVLDQYLSNRANREREATAIQMQRIEEVQERQIRAFETIGGHSERMFQGQLRLWAATTQAAAQASDNIIEYGWNIAQNFGANFVKALAQGRDFFTILNRLAEDAARAVSTTLSDFFFDAFNNDLKDAGDYWDAFLGSMKRAAANFLADASIRALIEFGRYLFEGGSGGGGGALDAIVNALKKAVGLDSVADSFKGVCVPMCGGGVGGATGGHTAGTPIPSSSVPGGITSWLNNLFFTPDHTRNPAIEDAFQDQRAGERDPTGAGSLLGTDSVQRIADSISFPIWSQDTFSGSDGGFFPQSDVPLTFDSNPITFENPTVNFDFDSFDWSGWNVPVSGLVAQDGIDFASILNDEAALRSLVESANAENLFASDLSRMLASGGSVASDVPVTVGTTSTQPTSGSAVNLSLGSTVGALGSAYSLFNILSGDAFGNDVATTIKALSNLNTLLSTAAKTAPSLLGELNPRVPGTNLTAASSTGALLNAALGAYQLSQGNYISGAGGLVSGAGTIASGIPALSGVAGLAGPIGLALQIAGLFSGDMTGSQRTLAIGQLATNLIIPQLASALLASAAAGGAAGVAAGATAAGGLSSLGSALLSTLTGGLIGGTAGAATGAAVGATAGTAVAGTAAGTAAAGTAAAGATAGATAGLAAAAPVLGVALPIAAWAYGLFLAIEQNTRGDYVPTRQKEAADLGRNIPEAARWIQATRTMEELNQFLHMLSLTEGNFISGKFVRNEQTGAIEGTHLDTGAAAEYLNAVIDRQRQLIMAAEAGNMQAKDIINRAADFKEDANLLYNVASDLVSQVGEKPPVMNAEELGNILRSLPPEQLNDLAGNASAVGKADARVTSVDEIQDLIRKYANLEIQEITSPWRLMDPENASGVNREFLISDISPQMRLEEVNQQISQLEALMAVLLLDPNALPTEQIQQLPNIIDALKQSVNQTTESLSRYATSQTVFYSNENETLQQVSQPPLSLYGTQAEVENMVRAYAEQGFQLTDISPQWLDVENQQSRWDFLVTPITPQAQVQAQAEANERLAQLETLLSILLLGNPGSSLPGLIAAASSLAPDTSLAAQAQAQETQQASVSGMVTLPTGTGILAPDAQQQFVEKLISATTPVILDPEMQKQLVEELSKYMPAWSDEKISEELLRHLAANSAIAGMVSPQQIMQQQQTGTLVPTVSPTILTSPTVTSTTATAPTTTTSTTITPTTPYYFGTVTNPYYIPEWYDIRSFDGFSEGGLVGIGMTGQRGLLDTVPAWLQPGEIVIRKDIADQYRDPLLSLNAGIPMSPIGEMRGASGFSVGQINIHVEGGSNPQETARAIRDELMRALRNLDDDTNERMMHNMGRTDRKKNMKMFGGTGAQSRLMGNFSG